MSVAGAVLEALPKHDSHARGLKYPICAEALVKVLDSVCQTWETS